MKITDAMIETAAQVLSSEGADTEHGWHGWRCFDQDRYPEPCGCTEDVARAVLEAVAPLIVAQALRHEADNAPGAWEVPVGVYHLDRTSRNYLRARAEQIEGGTTDADLEASLEWLESVAREREAGQ